MDLSAFNVWKLISILAVLLCSMLVANLLKNKVPFLRKMLIPTSVLGGILLLIVTTTYQAITGNVLFDTAAFSGDSAGIGTELRGSEVLEAITYHCLALGFIATSFKSTGKKITKERSREIFDSGVTTVSTYLLQGVFGLGFTLLAAWLIKPDLFKASGILLVFGYGQGTGQAYNYGNIYEGDGFVGGANFGLAIAALGFLSACIGGVIFLNHLRRKGKLIVGEGDVNVAKVSDFQDENEIPLSESMDKLTVQVAIVLLTYGLTYLLLFGLSALIPGMKSTIYGFNFLFGVLAATLVKFVIGTLTKKKVIKKQYVNNYLMNRLGGFFFDLMVVAGIAAINLFDLAEYWWILLILGAIGAAATYAYNLLVAKKLFVGYSDEQFLVMYGMLTGTASTGVILLREADPQFKTPAADNLVYQQFVAIVLGFPMLLLATNAPKYPEIVWAIVVGYFLLLNVVLFRKFIFKSKK